MKFLRQSAIIILFSCRDSLQTALLPIVIIMMVTTVLVFAAAGLVTAVLLSILAQFI